MQIYLITATAGKEVAGKRNEGVGTPIMLTDEQAAQPLRLGHVRIPPADPLDHDGDGAKGGSLPKSRRSKKV